MGGYFRRINIQCAVSQVDYFFHIFFFFTEVPSQAGLLSTNGARQPVTDPRGTPKSPFCGLKRPTYACSAPHTPPSKKRHMTCQIGSEEPPSTNSCSIDHKRRTTRSREVILDVPSQFPRRANPSEKLAADMYSRLVFLAVVVAMIGASVVADSGKFALRGCRASG